MSKGSKPKDSGGADRVLYLDGLRVFCIFSMMFLHVAASNWGRVPVTSFEWNVFNAYDSMVRFCVPVFVMISGVFLLDPGRGCTMKSLFCRKIGRVAAAFVFWSAAYAVVGNLPGLWAHDAGVLRQIAKQFVFGHYHLWFLYMIAGLYLIVPFLREICKRKELMEYFLILSFVFAFLINLLMLFPRPARILSGTFKRAEFHFALGYSGYFVLGYYLSRYRLPKGARALVGALGVLSIAATALGARQMSLQTGKPNQTLYGNLLPTTLLTSAAVFLLFQEAFPRIKMGERAKRTLFLLSKWSFGMYLVHDFYNILFRAVGFSTLAFNPVASVPVITVCVFLLSLLAVSLLDKIPVLNKYIL